MTDTMPRRSATTATSVEAEHTADAGIWSRVTRELADDLAVDAPARDRAGKPPFDEVARLREAGLPALLTPPFADRGGADWRTACAVVKEIAEADSSVGELLARHHVLSWSARLFGAAGDAARFERRAAEEQWLLAGGIEPPESDTEPDLRLATAGGGHVLTGSRSFAAGVTVADRLVVGARCEDTGDVLIALVDPAHPGVSACPVDDRVGQRLTGAGVVVFDGVPVGTDDILGTVPRDEHAIAPFSALAPLALRLILVHVALGIAEGALAEARDTSRAAQAAQLRADGRNGEYGERPSTDPYLLLAYGELATAAHTAAAVVDRATDALARGLLAGDTLSVDERSDIAVLVAAAEAVTSWSAVQITTRILELTDGTDAAHAGGAGFDRFWRNARVLTARNSATHRLRDIGAHYLNGTHPRLTRRV